MWMLGPVGFTAPLLLLALPALPLLWLLLRAVPPAPLRRRFPGVALLLGLTDEDAETERTPLWLLLLRMAALAAAIIAFAGPVLNPAPPAAATDDPLLIVVDGTWADARDWPRRIDRAMTKAEAAGRAGRTVGLIRLTDRPEAPVFQSAAAIRDRLAGLVPQPFVPADLSAWADVLGDGRFETYWLSDGLDHPGRADLAAGFAARGPLSVFQTPRPVIALKPPVFRDGAVQLAALRLPAGAQQEIEVSARGPDPAGIERELARATLVFATGQGAAEGTLDLPPELRNRLTRFEIAGQPTAGAVSLTDDSLKRRKVALVGSEAEAEGLILLSPTHYLRQAMAPEADLIDGSLSDVLLASPDVVVLTDVARLGNAEAEALLKWVADGGTLLRFAGPRLAAVEWAPGEDDPLLPVRLRAGGRNLGGAMSWGDPRTLAPFAEGSPFFGLAVPGEVSVTRQVLAEPGPDLAARTIASLADGTPLVTRKETGAGQVVLFHVTANAEWSSLPLSGLFVQMLDRLVTVARVGGGEDRALAGHSFAPVQVLDAFGVAQDADNLPGVTGEALAAGRPGPDLLPGLYEEEDRRVALNVTAADTTLQAAVWPAGTTVEGAARDTERPLKGPFLGAALALMLVDILAALGISGRLSGGLAARLMLALMLALPAPAARADAAEDAFAIEATGEVRLAHILTGDKRVDDLAQAGLRGLSMRLFERTTVEPGDPMAVDIERDELAFFPFLYWPVTADQPLPSVNAYRKLNDFLRTGGMILFDTRDAGVSGGTTPEAKRLQLIASGLDIPPLEPVPVDHVLTRTFYLLQDFPGRYTGPVWVEAAPPDAAQAEGMPFRNLNDGVTPVVIGGNGWAAAWAVDEIGIPSHPVGRGSGGDRQREIAYRFGINLVMHVLTGNYKSDQVHVPALLERLGQ